MATRPVPKEIKWLVLAAFVYVCLCLLMFHSQPSIRPLDVVRQGQRSKAPSLVSRGPREHQSIGGQELSHMTSLLKSHMFTDQGIKLKWIGERIARLGPSWEHAQSAVAMDMGYLFTRPQKILLFPGLLTEYSAYDFAHNAYKGGYLGELVQWSDLIATLHMLGHHLVILTSRKQLTEKVSLQELEYDLLFTDYIGLFGLMDSHHFPLYKCRIRVLDSFGTEPLYQFRTLNYQVDESMSMFNNWGLESTRQFWTLFPHTPDNSFLGFIVESPSLNDTASVKRNQAVIYGKEAWYRYGQEDMLNTIGEVMELHSTFKDPGVDFPTHIINHGVLPAGELQTLLQQSKLFVGLGFPYDGPGPLEALANGCVFLQPAFNPPHSSENTDFFDGKPTSRELSSQVPYLEHFIGKPFVYTVDVTNQSTVRETLYEILALRDHTPFVPYEFTQKGMLERVGTYLSHQNFCDGVNLALNRPASASSVYADHTPNEAVDGRPHPESCFWSASDDSHWWGVDLGADLTIVKIRITNTFEWSLAKSWGVVFLDPFIVTLLDSEGQLVASRRFTDSRTFYIWDDIHVRARHVRIDSLENGQGPRYFVLCALEVFGGSSHHPIWPDLTLLSMLSGKRGVSCKDVCMNEGLVCEPAYFKSINNGRVLRESFNCTDITTLPDDKFVDFAPAWSAEEDTKNNVAMGTCLVNNEPMLLSCAGRHSNYHRLCPCRRFTKGQVAIPPTL